MYQAPFFPYSRPSQSVQIYFDDTETLRSYHISWVHVETLIKKRKVVNLINFSGQVSRFFGGCITFFKTIIIL